MLYGKRAHLLCLVLVMGAIFFSCGNDSPAPVFQPQVNLGTTSELDRVCASPFFGFGRSIPYSELRSFGDVKFGLESVLFRDVLYRMPNEVELAYLIEIRMQLQQNPFQQNRTQANQFLVPEHNVICKEAPRPSRRSDRLSRTMFPVLGDLHLPSTRVTVYDDGARDSMSRISEVSVSSDGYFSFNQNWMPYRKIQSLSDYLELLRVRHFYSKLDVRDLGSGRIGIVAEKNIGGEVAQLLITLVEQQP